MPDKSKRYKVGGSKYITVHSNGYLQVRFGKVISCGFRDLAKAEAYRDAVAALLEKAKENYRGNLSYRMHSKLRTNDYIGVSFFEDAFVAQWTDEEGKRQKAYFNVNTHGHDKARSMAIAARDAAVGVYPREVMDEIVRLTKKAKGQKSKKRIPSLLQGWIKV